MFWFPSIILYADRLPELKTGHDAIHYDRVIPVCVAPSSVVEEEEEDEGYW